MRRSFLVVCLLALTGCRSGPNSDRKRVFVTSATYTGVLGGLSGADVRCNTAARAAGVLEGFAAWLSDVATDARDRIPGNGPWYRMDRSTLLFSGRTHLLSDPVAPIDMNEKGEVVPIGAAVWTGTSTGGTRSILNLCDNWTDYRFNGRIGLVSTIGWTSSGSISCSELARLYCFER